MPGRPRFVLLALHQELGQPLPERRVDLARRSCCDPPSFWLLGRATSTRGNRESHQQKSAKSSSHSHLIRSLLHDRHTHELSNGDAMPRGTLSRSSLAVRAVRSAMEKSRLNVENCRLQVEPI